MKKCCSESYNYNDTTTQAILLATASPSTTAATAVATTAVAPPPQWHIADAEIKDPSVENPDIRGYPIQAWRRSVLTSSSSSIP